MMSPSEMNVLKEPAPEASLARRLGPFDATMIVMGGIIGAGIFVNPSVVARQVHTPMLVLGAWVIGGVIALIGAFVYAELAALQPRVGGQYAYLREAYHPIVAFLYGWTLLLVVQTGGMAGAAKHLQSKRSHEKRYPGGVGEVAGRQKEQPRGQGFA